VVIPIDSSLILQAEQAILGAALLDPSVMDDLDLEPHHFANETHEILWRGFVYQYQNGKPIDIISITAALVEFNKIEQVGGVSYLKQLQESCPTTANVKEYADILRRESVARDVRKVALKLLEFADKGMDTASLLDKANRMMDSLQARNHRSSLKSAQEVAKEFEEWFESDASPTIPTGFKAFDDWCGGLGQGWLRILAGRPGAGKTAKAIQEAVHIAGLGIGPVYFVSLEMLARQLFARAVSAKSQTPFAKIRRKDRDEHYAGLQSKAIAELAALNIHFADSSVMRISDIIADIRTLKRRYGRIAAVYVDYLTLLEIEQEKGETRSRAVGEVTRKAKQIANELGFPFTMLAQLSREGAEGKPKIHHLRDSGEIEQDADMIEFLWTEDNPEGKLTYKVQSSIAKGRETGLNEFEYTFHSWKQCFE